MTTPDYCEHCGKEVVYNVPRIGASGGFIHKETCSFLCSQNPNRYREATLISRDPLTVQFLNPEDIQINQDAESQLVGVNIGDRFGALFSGEGLKTLVKFVAVIPEIDDVFAAADAIPSGEVEFPESLKEYLPKICN